mmetsp:Transcript_156993/g.273366  ORF Transcript_156993/g.273366 Transcript_156993/m.273366 type:complete len:366 (-) Transcript_156993:171-1268(-)
MATTLSAKWTWADAGFVNHGLAKRIPLWWSNVQDIQSTIVHLETYQSRQPNRRVKVCLYGTSSAADAKERREENVELQCEFLDIGAAVKSLQDILPASRSADVTEAGENVNELLKKSFYKSLADQVNIIVRWSRDAAVLWNAPWNPLETAEQTLRRETFVDRVEVAITLQIKVSLRDDTKIRYNTELGNTAAAAQLLFEVLDLCTKGAPDVASFSNVASMAEGPSVRPPPPPTATMPCVRMGPVEEAASAANFSNSAGALQPEMVSVIAPTGYQTGRAGLPPNETGYRVSPDNAMGYNEQGEDLEGLGYETPTWLKARSSDSAASLLDGFDSRRLGKATAAGDPSDVPDDYIMDLTALRNDAPTL